MADDKVLGIVTRVKGAAQASQDVGKVDKAVSGLHSRVLSFGSSLKSGVGTALTTFGGRIRQLGTGCAAEAGVGGLFSLVGGFKEAIGRAQEFGATVTMLMRLTGEDTRATSALSGAMEHFNIDAATQARLIGFLDKNTAAL